MRSQLAAAFSSAGCAAVWTCRQRDQRSQVRRLPRWVRFPYDLGHENFGRAVAVGPNVSELQPGDYVVATVRRKGSSIYDQIGPHDMTTDQVYFERGVSRRHGYLTECYVDDPEYIAKVPDGLRNIAVIADGDICPIENARYDRW